jgi:hypothetical protein
VLGPRASAYLVAWREHVGLVDEVWVDAAEFERLVADGRLEDALALCRGDLGEGIEEEWIYEPRDQHRRAVGRVLARLADAAEDAGGLQAAVEWTRQEVGLDPLAEEPHRRLIGLLAAAGDRAGALTVHRRFVERLRNELGIAPSQRLRELAGAIRAGTPPAGPADAVAAPVGDTRYAKRGELRASYQVVGDGQRDLVYATRSFEPIDLLWDDPLAACGLGRLAALGRLIVCDLPGWGSADTVDMTRLPTLQDWTDHLGLVMDATGSERAVIVGVSEAGLPALLFAATHPERVSELVLIAPYARFIRGTGYPWGVPPAVAEA